jgi:membrane dipeptidase
MARLASRRSPRHARRRPTAPRPPASADAALRAARRLLARHPVIDGHNDLAWRIRHHEAAPGDVEAYDLRRPTVGHTDLARLRAGGVGGQFWSVYVPGDAKGEGLARLQLEQIDIARRVIARYPERLALCLTARDVERALARGRIASLLGMEGGHAIENSLGALRAFYELGARYMTLTHNSTHDWADAALDVPRHGGLSRFGEEVVREMNRLGMLIDLAHVSPQVMAHALAVSEAPLIFSHSSCRALTDHPRNAPDDVLAKLPANGGVVMVTFVGPFVSTEAARADAAAKAAVDRQLGGSGDRATRRRLEREYAAAHPPPRATIGQVADHVDHARRLAGVDHIGIGGDYDGNDEWPVGLEDVASYPRLFAELIRRGWRERDLGKLANGNVLRVLRRAEAVAQRLRARRPPSLATIGRLDGNPA